MTLSSVVSCYVYEHKIFWLTRSNGEKKRKFKTTGPTSQIRYQFQPHKHLLAHGHDRNCDLCFKSTWFL